MTLPGVMVAAIFVAAFSAQAIAANVSATPSSAAPGSTVTVTVTGSDGGRHDWVGLFAVGTSNSSDPITWEYLSGTQNQPPSGLTSATLSFVLPSNLAPGQYLFNLEFDNGVNAYMLGASSNPITVTSGGGAVISVNGTSSGTAVSAGASMSVAVANGPGNIGDWMGICHAGVTPTQGQCDGAGYAWSYLNCASTYPPSPLSSATCRLSAPSAAGNYVAIFASNDGYAILASAPFTVSGGSSGASPSVTVDGTVNPGGSLQIAVSNDPGNPRDWIGICRAGSAPSYGQCDGAGYNWDYLNCSTTPPATGVTSGTCTLAAPSTPGAYNAILASNDSYAVLATAPFTVSVGPAPAPAPAPAVVQSITTHGTGILNGGPDGTQTFVWPFTALQDFRGVTAAPVAPGHGMFGYIHTLSAQNTTICPRAITIDGGSSANITTCQPWPPYVGSPGQGENIAIWYMANVPNEVHTLTFDFTQYQFGTGHDVPWIDAGFIELSGVGGVNRVVDTFNAGSVQNPSLRITPTAQSLVALLGATNSGPDDGSDLLTPGYTDPMTYEEGGDGIGLWISNATVPAGVQQTLTWQNDYWNQPVCADGTPANNAGSNGCTVILGAVAFSVAQ